MDVSFVIPCNNEEKQLPNCLDSILEQTIKPMQVIVVLNGCTDNSEIVAKQFQGRFVSNNIEFDIINSKKGKINARALGFSKARGHVIGSIDADSVLIPQWVQHVLDAFEQDNNIVGISGKSVYRNKSPSILLLNLFNSFSSIFSKKVPLKGNNCAIRNLNLNWYEGYENMKEFLETNGCMLESHNDDFFLMHRLKKHGEILYHKDAKASLYMKDNNNNHINMLRLYQRWQNRKVNGKMISQFFMKHNELIVD